MRYPTLPRLFLLPLLIIGLLAVGCDDSTTPEETENDGPMVNDRTPNANSLITSQTVYGDPDMKSTFWHMDGDAARGYSCTGTEDNLVGARLVSTAGMVQWEETIIYEPRSVLSLDTDRFTGTVVVGGFDADQDDLKDQGALTLIDTGGSVVYEIFLDDPVYPLFFNTVEAVSDSLFLCLGGAEVDEVIYPILCSLLLDADGALHIIDHEVVTGLPSGWFLDLEISTVTDGPLPGETTVEFFTSGVDEAESAGRIRLNALRTTMHDLGGTEVLWTSFVVGYDGLDSFLSTGHSLALTPNGKLYVSGSSDVNKEPNPDNGGYWDAGLVACLSTSGTVEWINRIVLSTHSERYYDVIANSDGVYAIGRYSSYMKDGAHFTLSLLSRFDLDTGTLDYHLAMGNPECSQSLYCMEIDGTTATAAGNTNRFDDDSYQGWFVTVDLSSPPEELKIRGGKQEGLPVADESREGPGSPGPGRGRR